MSGCNTPTGDVTPPQEGGYYTVTFHQDGQKDVTRSVKAGEKLDDIPTPVEKDGYTTIWDKTEFSSVSEDMLVLAIATANEYTISFDLYSTWGEVAFEKQTQTVTFDSAYILEDPTLYGFFFTGWKIKGEEKAFDSEGTYKVADDITLVPTWEKDEESYRWWGGLV